MQNKTEYAAEIFTEGFNCAQSVLAPFCEGYSLDKEQALKLSSGLGGGCNLGELCGAVMCAAMVIGLKDGWTNAKDTAARSCNSAKLAQFIDEFKTAHGSVVCRDLLGYDITTEEGMAKKQAIDRAISPCNSFVRTAVEILEKSGY